MFKPFTKKKAGAKKTAKKKSPFPPKGTVGSSPPMGPEDDAGLDAQIGATFRGGTPGGGKSLPSRPPWA